jgi:hypothetical protein
MSKWMLFIAKWTIIQQYHGKNKVHVKKMMMTLALY